MSIKKNILLTDQMQVHNMCRYSCQKHQDFRQIQKAQCAKCSKVGKKTHGQDLTHPYGVPATGKIQHLYNLESFIFACVGSAVQQKTSKRICHLNMVPYVMTEQYRDRSATRKSIVPFYLYKLSKNTANQGSAIFMRGRSDLQTAVYLHTQQPAINHLIRGYLGDRFAFSTMCTSYLCYIDKPSTSSCVYFQTPVYNIVHVCSNAQRKG